MATQGTGRKVGVVLSGGGAKGAFEVGVLKALESRGIRPDIYCGTSVGSFNAAMAASGKTPAQIEKVWTAMTTRDVFTPRFDPMDLFNPDPRVQFKLALQSAKSLGSLLSQTLRQSGKWWQALDLDDFLLNTAPLHALIERNVDIQAVRRLGGRFSVALTRLKPSQGDALQLVDGSTMTHRHIVASTSIPLIFPPIETDGGIFCDGGVVMNSPLKPAISAGAEDIFVVDITPPPSTFDGGTLPLAYHVLSAQFSSALHRDIQYANDLNAQYMAAFYEGRLSEGKLEVRSMYKRTRAAPELKVSRYRYLRIVVISPSTDLGGLKGLLSFEPDNARKLIADGEECTQRVLDLYSEEEVEATDGAHLRMLVSRA